MNASPRFETPKPGRESILRFVFSSVRWFWMSPLRPLPYVATKHRLAKRFEMMSPFYQHPRRQLCKMLLTVDSVLLRLLTGTLVGMGFEANKRENHHLKGPIL